MLQLISVTLWMNFRNVSLAGKLHNSDLVAAMACWSTHWSGPEVPYGRPLHLTLQSQQKGLFLFHVCMHFASADLLTLVAFLSKSQSWYFSSLLLARVVMCLVPGELEESLRPPVAEIFGTAHTTVMRFSTRIYQVHNSNRASAKTVRVISCHMTTSYLGWNYATGAEAHELCDAHQLPRARSGLHEDVEGLSKWDWVRVYQVYGTTTDPKVMWSGCISIHA